MNRKTAFGLLSILVVMSLTLAVMGRRWWCDCGDPVPWSWDIWSRHNSQHGMDPYFFTHVLHGVLFFWVIHFLSHRARASEPLPHKSDGTVAFLMAAVLEAAWEILENSPMMIERYRQATAAVGYTGDSMINSIVDVIACLVGYFLASVLNWRWVVIGALLIELALLFTIRDSLLLNVIMLLAPVQAIKDWQTPGLIFFDAVSL